MIRCLIVVVPRVPCSAMHRCVKPSDPSQHPGGHQGAAIPWHMPCSLCVNPHCNLMYSMTLKLWKSSAIRACQGLICRLLSLVCHAGRLEEVPTLPAIGLGRQNAFSPTPTPATGQVPPPAAAAYSNSSLQEAVTGGQNA